MDNKDNTPDAIRDMLTGAKLKVFDAFAEFGAMTDDELVRRTGIGKGTASPRRNDLLKLGLVEVVGNQTTERGRPAKVYALVAPENRDEARDRQRSKKARRRALADFSLDERLEMARQLLDMDDLNERIRETNGRAWSRVRGRSQDQRSRSRRAVQENEAALREAERQNEPTVEFYKLRRALLSSTERVRAVRQLVGEELWRKEESVPAISADMWPEVSDLLVDLHSICEDTNAQIKRVIGVLGDDVIDGNAIEIELIESNELPEG